MKKIVLMSLMVLYAVTSNSQEITSTKPIKTFYKSGDQVIQTTSTGNNVVFLFQDENYNQIDVIESVNFKDKESMLSFFDKVSEVQNSPKSEKTVDLIVNMTKQTLNDKEVQIIRRGYKQFVTYIYVGNAYSIIPKSYLKRLIKKINK